MPQSLDLRASLLRPRSVALIALVLGTLALASLDATGRSAAQPLDLGEENSWLRIQNVGRRAATVEIEFYDVQGVPAGGDRCPSGDDCGALAPGFGWSFFQQGFAPLSEGYRGSAFVTVDQPFVALLARDVFKDGQFQIAGDTLRLGAGSAEQYAPVVQRSAAYVSRLSVENTSDTQEACFQIAYYAQGFTGVVALDPPGATPGCPQGGALVAPRGTLLRDEHSLPLLDGFDGAAIVRSFATASGVPAAAQLLALVVDTREREGPGLAMYRGFDASELSREIVLPLVDRNASEGQTTWTTRFRILNGTPGVPNEVQLLFAGRDANGDETEIEHSVTVFTSLTCDQRHDGPAGCLPEGVPLPATFFGSVRIQATEPVAVVAQRVSEVGALADYRGFTAEEASREVVLPVLNKNFGPWGDHRGWNSWFRVLTFDGSEARMSVVYYSKYFPTGLVSPPLRVDRQKTLRQWENGRLPDGWVGSAIVIADRPIVVLANLESDVFAGDPVMLYNGVSVR